MAFSEYSEAQSNNDFKVSLAINSPREDTWTHLGSSRLHRKPPFDFKCVHMNNQRNVVHMKFP